MFLSKLLIDIGDNPDRPRLGRLWLRNIYHVHQRLAMAFPSDIRKTNDPQFLKPYDPKDFPEYRHLADKKADQIATGELRHVHEKRDQKSGFLFRIDSDPGHGVVIFVLSAIRPDWDYAFHNAPFLLVPPMPEPSPLQLEIKQGSTFRFRLLANPVFRIRGDSVNKHGKPYDAKWVGKRIPVKSDSASLCNWLERRATGAGFILKKSPQPLIQTGFVYFNKMKEKNMGQRLFSVRYDGLLEVTEPTDLQKAICSGIGPAKAFGFGLLSLAPM